MFENVPFPEDMHSKLAKRALSAPFLLSFSSHFFLFMKFSPPSGMESNTLCLFANGWLRQVNLRYFAEPERYLKLVACGHLTRQGSRIILAYCHSTEWMRFRQANVRNRKNLIK
jgi:hypothetical protein